MSVMSNESFLVSPVPAFSDNYIWLLRLARRDGGSARPDVIVVDPGDAAPVIAVLDAQQLRLSAILLTHHHRDHVGGVEALLAWSAEKVPVYGPATEDIPHVDHPVRGGDSVEIAAPHAHFTVIDVPGHTRGHIAYFQPAQGGDPPRLFCGDTLFAAGCGRLFEGTPAQMVASLNALIALPSATAVHCAHEYTLSNLRFARACEPDNEDLRIWTDRAQALRAADLPTLPTTLDLESRVNPFLRTAAPAVQAAVSARLGRPPQDAVEAFATLRAWKDSF